MPEFGFTSPLPLAATMDLQGRLPPMQQTLFSPTIIVSVVLLGIVLVIVAVMAQRARARAKLELRLEALRMAEKILLKRGGDADDVNRMLYIFKTYPHLDPAALVMVKERFRDQLLPLLTATFDAKFADRMEKLYFPPPKDTRRGIAQQENLQALVEERKSSSASQAAAALLDLMDATLRPGVVMRATFEGLEGGHQCLVMGHDMQSINITLPANNDQLVASLTPGLGLEGSVESGPSLLAFTSSVIQAFAGSMPYCRISAWKSAWEVRKRDSVRLPISLDIDFQHITTAATDSIKMSSLQKEIGTIRPGKLMDLSLGGCCIETPSSGQFTIGDMIRFSKSLISGSPPATLLGAVVNVDKLDPAEHAGSTQRLHVQFLVIDDVSQRLLVRTLKQLQDVNDRDEWMQAQQLLQKMRRNKITAIGSPAPPRRDTTGVIGKAPKAAPGKTGAATRTKPPTRAIPKGPGRPPRPAARPSTRSIPKPPPS